MSAVMAAALRNQMKLSPDMAGPLTGSVLFHAVVVILLVIGIPYIRKDAPKIEEAIAIELVAPENEAPKPRAEKTEKMVKERPPQNDKPPPEVVPRKAEPKPLQKEMPKPKEPEALKDDVAPPKKAEAKPEPKPKPAPPKKPVLTQPEPETQEEFRSLLKNLLPDEAVQSPDELKTSGQKESPLDAFSQRMTQGELGNLQAQISQCWKLMSGARYAENLIVDIKIFVNPDRTVRDAQIVDVLRYNADSHYRAAADSALRAVLNPRCNPLDLPPQKYDLWKVMTISFDPRDLL